MSPSWPQVRRGGLPPDFSVLSGSMQMAQSCAVKFAALADLAAVGFIIIWLESIRLMMCVLLLSWHARWWYY